MEGVRSPLASIPPFGVFDPRFWESAKDEFRAPERRLDEPAKLSLGALASLQSPLSSHLPQVEFNFVSLT